MTKRIKDLRRSLGLRLYGKPLTRRPRLGIYGGQLDMIHYGHLLCGQWTRWKKNLDMVLYVPCGESPNDKPDSLPGEPRYDMSVAATASNPHFDVSRSDITRHGTSFMLNTVEGVLEDYGQDVELFVLISSEYLNPDHKYWLPKWIGLAQMLQKDLTFLVFPRDRDTLDDIERWRKMLPKHMQKRVEGLDAPSPPLASSSIRDWVKKGRSIWYTTPWPVQEMINKLGHYRAKGQPAYKHEAPPIEEVTHVGLYPGALDPIHYGDLLRAEWARQELNMGRVVFVPSATPPNNRGISDTAQDRYDMAVAATANNPFFDVWRTEIDSGQVSYTLQTVEEARRRFGKDVQLSVMLRQAYLDPKNEFYLPKWFGAERLFELVKFVVFPDNWTQIEQTHTWAKQVPNATIEVVYAPSQPIDAADIRGLVAAGLPTLYCTPADVAQIIAKRGLYGSDEAAARAIQARIKGEDAAPTKRVKSKADKPAKKPVKKAAKKKAPANKKRG